MLALYDSANARLAVVYNSLTMNNPSDNESDTIEINGWTSRTLVDFVADGRQDKDGLEAHAPRKQGRVYVMNGILRAPTVPELWDRIKQLASTFHPRLLA